MVAYVQAVKTLNCDDEEAAKYLLQQIHDNQVSVSCGGQDGIQYGLRAIEFIAKRGKFSRGGIRAQNFLHALNRASA